MADPITQVPVIKVGGSKLPTATMAELVDLRV